MDAMNTVLPTDEVAKTPLEKIVYVVVKDDDNDSIETAASQLLRITDEVLHAKDIKNLSKVLVMAQDSGEHIAKILLYFSAYVNNVVRGDNEKEPRGSNNLSYFPIKDSRDMDQISACSEFGQVAIVGVTQSEMVGVLNALRKMNYIVPDNSQVGLGYDVHALSINPSDPIESSFFVAPWGK